MRCLLSLASKSEFAAAFFLCGLFLFGAANTSQAQKKRPKPKADDEEETDRRKLGGIETSLIAKDGLRMECMYYPGPAEKDTIPVVLLHGWKGEGSDFKNLALYLQSDRGGGHSVIAPDLRGHGGSTLIKPEGAEKGKEIDSKKTGKKEFQAMIKFDLEAVKKFLMTKHNDEELNIDALTVVGADMGALLAMYWTAQDWSWPPLAGIKQGQDVKAVALLSTPTSFKGINPQVPLKQMDLRDHVSLLMLYGGDDQKTTASTTRLYNSVKRHRKQVFDSKEEKIAKQDLFLVGLETSLQGADLLSESELPTPRYIAQFIDGRVRKPMEDKFPWKPRRRGSE